MKKLTEQTKTLSEKDIKRSWKLFDAKNQVLGRFASDITAHLIGKNKADYAPNLDCGDNVVVINAAHIVVTGSKADDKVYTKYSGYPGGLRTIPFKDMKNNKPEEILEHAISGMLPKNKLRQRRMTRLFVFKNENHSFKNKFTK